MLSVLSVLTLGVLVNWLAGGLLAFTIFFYVVIYTMWLKRWTPQNIVIGGAAGAFPPMIGWAAATGSIGLESVILFLIIFLWTPPHFWALALFKSDDYARAGIPMMPNVAGEASTRRQIFAYARGRRPRRRAAVVPRLCRRGLRHVPPHLAPASSGMPGRVLLMPDADRAMKPDKALFGYSILYLFGIFAAYLADAVAERAARVRRLLSHGLRTRHPHRQAEEGAPQPLDRDRAGLFAMVVIFYVATIVKFGPAILDRSL